MTPAPIDPAPIDPAPIDPSPIDPARTAFALAACPERLDFFRLLALLAADARDEALDAGLMRCNGCGACDVAVAQAHRSVVDTHMDGAARMADASDPAANGYDAEPVPRVSLTVTFVDSTIATLLMSAKAAFESAWAARDRYRARNQRLARRREERMQQSRPAAAVVKDSPRLPPAVEAALARARAKAAAGRGGTP